MHLQSHRLVANGHIPNNPALPLLVYPSALTGSASELAAEFERRFDAHQWPAAWRNGIHPYHHYHSTAHEVLGIYSGVITVCFGGAGGPQVRVQPGDAVIIPAGVSHQRIALEGTIGVVGAYPQGQIPDLCRGSEETARNHAETIAALPVPRLDPIYAVDGPLHRHWH